MNEYLKAHKEYITYFLRHKYWVYRIGRKMGLSRWRLIKHDLSKLLPSEWFGYVKWKYGQIKAGGGGMANDRAFGMAWFLHMKRNDHHWQYWIYTDDNGQTYPIEIPEPQRTELLVDWCSAGVVRFGEPGLHKYYEANKDKMPFHPITRVWIEATLAAVEGAYEQCQADDAWR